MRLLAVTAVLAVALAGCTAPAQQPLEPAAANVEAPTVDAPEPVTVEWKGHVVTSTLEVLAHMSATEPHVAPLYKEGFLFDIQEVPQALRVDLVWEGQADGMMIMLHAPHGKGGYVEYINEMNAEREQCIMVEPSEIEPGHWQIMTHSRGAMNVQFTLKVTTVGGVGAIIPDAPHGHALDEEFNIEEGTVLPCPSAEDAGDAGA